MLVYNSLLDEAFINAIKNGAIAVIPTDTVYGLVCRAADQSAVAKLYALKHREHKPGTVVAADVEKLVGLGIKRRYLKAVEQFWPGAVPFPWRYCVEHCPTDPRRNDETTRAYPGDVCCARDY